jgi:riboflavin synthase
MASLFSLSSPPLYKTPPLGFSFSLNPTPSSVSFRRLQLKPTPRFSRLVTNLFTGIVEEIGHIEQVGPDSDSEDRGFEMRIGADVVLGGTRLGDSIAVNGTCLTVTEIDSAGSRFSVGLSPETLRRTSLGGLGPGSPVNLERALTPESRMGGHFVQVLICFYIDL